MTVEDLQEFVPLRPRTEISTFREADDAGFIDALQYKVARRRIDAGRWSPAPCPPPVTNRERRPPPRALPREWPAFALTITCAAIIILELAAR